MTPQNQAILDGLSNNLQTALTKLTAAQSSYDTTLANVRELQRQAEVHRNSGAENDLQNVNRQLTAAYPVLDVATATLNDAKQVYAMALSAYDATAKRLLTPAEAQAHAAAVQQQAVKPSFFKSTGGIITISLTALTLIGITIKLLLPKKTK
jgi:hypothetical protein